MYDLEDRVDLDDCDDLNNSVIVVFDKRINGSLEKFREEKGITEEQAKKIFRQTYVALRTMHALGLVHSDVKPGNFQNIA